MARSGARDSLGPMSGRRARGTSVAAAVTRRRGAVRVVVLLLGLVSLVATGGWLTSAYLVSEEVSVPAVGGLAYPQAAERLLEAGLTPRPFAELDPRALPNQVLSQAPAAGQWVRPGRQVAVGVNTAPEARRTPELVGLRERDAIARAEAVGAGVERVVYVHADAPVGTVVRQEPLAGTALAPAQTLVVSVSRGAVDVPFEMPDLRGRPVEFAEAELAALGIRHVERVAAAVSFDRPGAVTDQRPVPGSEVRATTPITLVFAVAGTRVVRVPDLLGLPLWRAQLALRAAQLDLGAVRRVDDASLPGGVVESWPAGYTVAGSPVAVVINGAGGALELDAATGLAWPEDVMPPPLSGAREPTLRDVVAPLAVEPVAVPAPGTSRRVEDGSRIIPFRFDPATVGIAGLLREPYRLKLVVADDEGERTVFDRVLAAGEGVEEPVRVVGDEALLQTYINELFFQAWRP